MSWVEDELAGRLASLTTLRISEELRQTVRFRVADVLAARELGLLLNGEEVASVGAQNLAKSIAAARFTEADDIHIRSCTTAGAVVVPTALQAAKAADLNDEDAVVRLVVAGYEALIRLGAALDGPRLIFEGWWPTGLCAAAAVAAIRCQVERADAGPTSTALVAAACHGVDVASAEEWSLERLGQICVDELHVASNAASSTLPFGGLPLHEGSLDDEWQILKVETKAFPSSRQALPAVEALVAARSERPTAAIERILVEVPEQIRQMIDLYPPRTRLESLVSVRHQLSRAFDGDALNDAARRSLTLTPEATELAERVEVRGALDLTSRYPSEWPARMRVWWQDGWFEGFEVMQPRGSAQSPLSWQALREKWGRIFHASGVTHASFADLIERARQSVALTSLTTMEGNGLG